MVSSRSSIGVAYSLRESLEHDIAAIFDMDRATSEDLGGGKLTTIFDRELRIAEHAHGKLIDVLCRCPGADDQVRFLSR